MTRLFSTALVLTSALTLGLTAQGQQEGPLPTQALVNVDAKSTPPAGRVRADGAGERPQGAAQRLGAGCSGERAGGAADRRRPARERGARTRQPADLFRRRWRPESRSWSATCSMATWWRSKPFTTDHAQAACALHLPEGMPGMSASPYLCLSDFVKHWPSSGGSSSVGTGWGAGAAQGALHPDADQRRRPVQRQHQRDESGQPLCGCGGVRSQRAGVAVYAIYFGDAGIRGGSADNSGQGYLAQLTQGTGGVSLWEGVGNPVSMAPFLDQFQHAIAETYIATFLAPTGKDPQRDMARVKFSAGEDEAARAGAVLPGNQE